MKNSKKVNKKNIYFYLFLNVKFFFIYFLQVPSDKKTGILKSLKVSSKKNTFGLDTLGMYQVISPFDMTRCIHKSQDSRLLVSGIFYLFSYDMI